MNTLLLSPADVLFFRDGRPMSGSLAGHGSAWPLPTVTNAALHAALWRAEIGNVHTHRAGKNGTVEATDGVREHKFGCLTTVGPFPVLGEHDWLFPRPLDAGLGGNWWVPSLRPLAKGFDKADASLPGPLEYPVANTLGPTKQEAAPWWNLPAWQAYVEGTHPAEANHFWDADFSDVEFSFGIGIDPATGTQDGERFYSAHYLRLRTDVEPCVRLGLLASALDKVNGDATARRELLDDLFLPDNGKNTILVGGQQRICSVERLPEQSDRPLPLPRGLTKDFRAENGKALVKWTLLTPAIFPAISPGTSVRGIQKLPHPGGWLPNWVFVDWDAGALSARDHARNGAVLLRAGIGESKGRRCRKTPGEPLSAKLVAAAVGKPVPVSGHALPHEAKDEVGHKPCQLAVPAGSVYYFETQEPEKLAAALNWHGDLPAASTIVNRRSSLFGEKGFGLGVCSSWRFHSGNPPQTT